MHRSILKAVIVVAAGLFLAVAATAAPTEIKTLEIGARAPDFALPGVDGRMHRLADYRRAKVLAIIFTCNHCPTAQAYEERMQKLAVDFKDRGVVLLAISPNDPKAVRLDELGYTDVSDSFRDMKLRARDKGFTFPYLYDGNKQAVSKAYGPMSTPHVFIFDAERKLRYVGRIDDNERDPQQVKSRDTRNAIEALLAGKAVPVEKTKTVGCSIKWSDKRGSVKQAFEKWAKEPITLHTLNIEDARKLVKNDSNKLRLINIWATYCGPCVAEFPELVEINRMYRGREFEMVGVNVQGPGARAQVQSFLAKNQASFTNYVYDGQDVYAFIEAVDPKWPGPIPYTLLVKPGGEILYRHLGAIDSLEVKRAIVDYLGRTYK